ncbi:MAG: transcription termination/antitermination NusG family protein [Bryobacteraceae bacterium]
MSTSAVRTLDYPAQSNSDFLCLTNPEHAWFGVRVRSNCEAIVSTGLRSKGLEEFAPLYSSRRRWSDRIRTVQLPLFPGYVFARFDPSVRTPVLATPGVVHILSLGGRPEPIDEKEIVSIRSLLSSGISAEPWPFLRVGQRVNLANGPLKGVEGIVVDLKQGCRLIVSVTLLQRSIAVEIERNWIGSC